MKIIKALKKVFQEEELEINKKLTPVPLTILSIAIMTYIFGMASVILIYLFPAYWVVYVIVGTMAIKSGLYPAMYGVALEKEIKKLQQGRK
jgi:hypothetical protein